MIKLKDLQKHGWEYGINEVVCCDALDGLKALPDESIDMLITSPPYWSLRCYLPDKVRLKENLTPEEKAKILKKLTLLGIKGIIR